MKKLLRLFLYSLLATHCSLLHLPAQVNIPAARITGLQAAIDSLAAYQPLDADLTAIAALTTTSFGQSLLTQADASAARTTLGLAIGSDVQPYSAYLDPTSSVQTQLNTNAGAISTNATAISTETSRATAAEATKLSLSGGTMTGAITASTGTDLIFNADNGASATNRLFQFNGGRIVTDGTANFEHHISMNADTGYGVTAYGDNVMSIQQMGTSHGQCAIRYLDPTGQERAAAGLGLRSGFENAYFVEIGGAIYSRTDNPVGFKIKHTLSYASGVGDILPVGYYTPFEINGDGSMNIRKFQSGPRINMGTDGTLLFGKAADATETGAGLYVQEGTNSGVWMTCSGSGAVKATSSAAAANAFWVQNTNSTGYSTTRFLDSSSNEKGVVGYANASAANSTLKGNVFLLAASGSKLILMSSGSVACTLGTDQKTVFVADVSAPTLTSTVATGTAPLTVTSTTRVANLNVATAGAVDGLSVTAGKTLTASNTLTFTGTDGSTLAIGTGGTLGTAAFTAATDYATAAQGTKADNAGAVTGIVKSDGSATFSAAVAGTDYAKVPLTATATLDFGSISAAAQADLTITVTGAAVGDACTMGLPAAPDAGIVFNTFVSAADTVTIRASNITASPVDPASATYRATVFKP